MKQAKKRVSITLDDEVIEKLKVLAKDDDRSLSQYINKLLKTHIGAKEGSGGMMD